MLVNEFAVLWIWTLKEVTFVLLLISYVAVQCSVTFTVLLRLYYLPSWTLRDDHNLVYITTKQKRYQETIHSSLINPEQFLYFLNLYITKHPSGRIFSLRVFASIWVSWLHTHISLRVANCTYMTCYEGDSNENLKSAIKIRNAAQLSHKLTIMILMVWRVADRWQYDAGTQNDGAVVV
jgi:hypothetical protein